MHQYTLDDLDFKPVTDPEAGHCICMKCGIAKPVDNSHTAVLQGHTFFVCSDICLQSLTVPADRWDIDQHITNAIAADEKAKGEAVGVLYDVTIPTVKVKAKHTAATARPKDAPKRKRKPIK